MKKLLDILDWALIAIGIFAILLNAACGGGNGGQSNIPTPRPQVTFETDRGATVTVFEGEDPTPEDLAEIDRQISRMLVIVNGLDRGYVWPGHTRHKIDLVAPSDKCETPGSFQVPAGQYGGDLICVAGQFLHESDRIRTTIVAIRTSKIIQYESEHFGLKYNDEALYLQTLTHRPPNGHPIFGIE